MVGRRDLAVLTLALAMLCELSPSDCPAGCLDCLFKKRTNPATAAAAKSFPDRRLRSGRRKLRCGLLPANRDVLRSTDCISNRFSARSRYHVPDQHEHQSGQRSAYDVHAPVYRNTYQARRVPYTTYRPVYTTVPVTPASSFAALQGQVPAAQGQIHRRFCPATPRATQHWRRSVMHPLARPAKDANLLRNWNSFRPRHWRFRTLLRHRHLKRLLGKVLRHKPLNRTGRRPGVLSKSPPSCRRPPKHLLMFSPRYAPTSISPRFSQYPRRSDIRTIPLGRVKKLATVHRTSMIQANKVQVAAYLRSPVIRSLRTHVGRRRKSPRTIARQVSTGRITTRGRFVIWIGNNGKDHRGSRRICRMNRGTRPQVPRKLVLPRSLWFCQPARASAVKIYVKTSLHEPLLNGQRKDSSLPARNRGSRWNDGGWTPAR